VIAALVLAASILGAPGSPRLDDLHRADLPLVGQEMYQWGLARDSWRLTDDKVAHFGMGFATTSLSAWAFRDETPAERRGILAYNLAFWFLWEIKDGFGGWEKRAIYGDGFSIADFGYSAVGCLLAMAIR